MGEPILLHRLRCNPFAVAYYDFKGNFLTAAATSTRESSWGPELFIKAADTPFLQK
jgi:hypothetical protein